jgi:hypothetical protein
LQLIYISIIIIIEAEIEFEHFISNQRIWKLVALYTGTEPLITYEEAVEMGCFENHNNYFSVSKKLFYKKINS